MTWLFEVEKLNDFSILGIFPDVKWVDIQKLELHAFCDALPLAYSTVIYMCGYRPIYSGKRRLGRKGRIRHLPDPSNLILYL